MEILKSAVILVIGFVLLIKGADYFVEGSSSVAKKFKVPSLIIGMTIVAMGTSLPDDGRPIAHTLNNCMVNRNQIVFKVDCPPPEPHDLTPSQAIKSCH